MAISLTRISWRWWGGKEKEKEKEPISNGPSMDSLPDFGFGLKDQDGNSKFGSSKIACSIRKVKRKWKSREERKTNQMIRTGQSGGLNRMHLIFRVMMIVLLYWFVAIVIIYDNSFFSDIKNLPNDSSSVADNSEVQDILGAT